MPEKVGLPTGVGQAGDRDKFKIQSIKGFDCYLGYRWFAERVAVDTDIIAR